MTAADRRSVEDAGYLPSGEGPGDLKSAELRTARQCAADRASRPVAILRENP